MNKPIKKVVPEPSPTDPFGGHLRDGELELDIRNTGATIIVTVMNGMALTPSARRRLVTRYPGAIIIG
jgi:hypothetical protein